MIDPVENTYDPTLDAYISDDEIQCWSNDFFGVTPYPVPLTGAWGQ
jgi:hypothetical protein